MTMVPKYQPVTHRPIASFQLTQLAPDFSHWRWFRSARGAMAFVFNSLNMQALGTKREILLPGFICDAVISAVLSSGFRPRFYDLSINSLYPAPESLVEHVDKFTLAVVLAPYFGVIQTSFFEALAHQNLPVPLILDMAQGAGCSVPNIKPVASVYSFGLGKGTDFWGGGLAFNDLKLDIGLTKGLGFVPEFSASLGAIAARQVLKRPKLSAIFGPLTESVSNRKKNSPEVDSCHVPSGRWLEATHSRCSAFVSSIPLAQDRASSLYREHSLAPWLFPLETVDRDHSSFLRFPLLARTASEAEDMCKFFKTKKIALTTAAENNHSFDCANVKSLNTRILKLPYLGSLSNSQFDQVQNALLVYARAFR